MLTELSLLKLLPPVSETRVSFSNFSYLLTVLSSLKFLQLLVSETRVSFSNYAYLLIVLSSLKLSPRPVSKTRVSFSNYAYLLIVTVVKVPHYTRDRWLDLNSILDQNKKAITLAEGKSIAYSHVSWDDIKLVYEPFIELTTIPPKQIPDNTLTRLHDYLYTASRAFISTSPVKEAQLLHFIAPMLVHISPLLNDMKILIESDIPGKNIHVHGHFEFVVQQQNIRVCVIEARGDLFKGILQCNLD